VTTPSKEEQLRRLIAELRLMQGTAETLQRRLELLRSAAADLRVAESSIGALRDLGEGTPILVPMGGGALVNANLGDLSRVIVGVGADVSVEMDLEGAMGDISARLAEVERTEGSVQQQLERVLGQMQLHQDGINRLGAELRGEAAGV